MTTPPPDRPTNRLARETSAYLRQHMYNPVDWHSWGEEAFELARRDDKPLLVSIGYSACHWCHVMEHESFEDAETAAIMNRGFVSIKVDREERPDVDQIYMDAVTRLTGHGGWPLTAFCTPDGRPFYAGTYFPPEPRHGLPSFRQLLEGIEQAYRTRRSEIERSATEIVAALAEAPRGVASAPPGADSVVNAARRLLSRADRTHGGFGGAPKFPTPTSLEVMLSAADVLPPDEAADVLGHVVFTCREMSRRGLYDHLGGGFHRYCVDERWAVPHFEKMLYDQGQLLRVYADALRRSGDDDLAWPIRETCAYLAREMTAPEGGLYASQDADSDGEEGTFYVWTPAQVEAVLAPEAAARFRSVYGVSAEGNFEGRATVLADEARGPRADLAGERAALLDVRRKRPAPATDTKRVAGWNGLAVSGLALAASVTGDAEALAAATRAADFALAHLVDETGRLLRVYDGERAHVSGFLDDHACLLTALLDLHRAGGGDRYFAAAREIAASIASRFYDADEGDFFLTPVDGERLVHRPRSDHDGATPHSAGLATLALLRFASLSGDRRSLDIAQRVLRTHAFVLERAPEAFPTMARAALAAERGLSVAVVVGDRDDPATEALAAHARTALAPDDAVLVSAPGTELANGIDPTWRAGREPVDGRPTAWVCRGVSCSLPIHDPRSLAPLAPEDSRA